MLHADLTHPPRSAGSMLPRGERAALAQVAFGSVDRRDSTAIATTGVDEGRHLAFVSADVLALDLSDPAQRQFGDYELIELIGEGGMGVVYRARQVSLDRDVAMKLLSAGPWASTDFIQRFRQEAQNAARMQHPNIVAIHEVGGTEGLHFFSMRLVRGTSLAQVIRAESRLTPLRAATLLRTIAEAVDYAHRLGVLHLDLKPGNVLVDEAGEPHVADFGLARRIEQDAAAHNVEVSGTPSYMAPEQATAGRITAATDIWGLGAIAYEMLTGQPPFLGESPESTLRMVVCGELTSPRQTVPGLSRDLEAIVLKCMARDGGDRYASARELADDLGRFLDHRPVRARPLNRPQRVLRWTRRQPVVAGLLALFIIALVAGVTGISVQWRRAEHNADSALRSLWSSRSAGSQRFIADGEAYLALDGALDNLREMEANGATDLAAIERLRIGTVLANAPHLVDVVPIGSEVHGLELAPDSSAVAVANGRLIRLIDTNKGSERWRVDTARQSFSPFGEAYGEDFAERRREAFSSMRYSRDGHRIVVHSLPMGRIPPRPSMIDTVLVDADRGEIVRPPAEFAEFLATNYSVDGHFALLFDKRGKVQLWRVAPWEPVSALVPVSNGPQDLPLDEAFISADGKVVVGCYDDGRRFRMLDPHRLAARKELRLETAQGAAYAWMLSHDGRLLALGTGQGQVLLWSTDDDIVRTLQSNTSHMIARIEFSGDDRRLLVTAKGGELLVFDVASGKLVVAPIRLAEGEFDGSGIGHDGRTVWTRSFLSSIRLWDLPDIGAEWMRAGASAPSLHGEQTRFALASDPLSRLMVSSDNAQVKIWRSPAPALGERVAAPMVADTLRARDGLLAAVRGNRVEVFDVGTRRTIGVPVEVAQPPTFAGLDSDAASLVVIAGRQLSFWDWRKGELRGPAVELPDSPVRLSFAASAPVFAVSTSGRNGSEDVEHVRVFDTADGHQHGEPVELRGHLFAARLSPDGRRLLYAVATDAPAYSPNVAHVIDIADRRVTNLSGKPGTTAAHARFADDGSIWTVSALGGEESVSHWSPEGQLLVRSRLVSIGNLAVGAVLPLPAGRAVVLGAQGPLLVAPDGAQQLLPTPSAVDLVNAAALSPDASLLALATTNGVLLIDLAHCERLLPELKIALSSGDLVQQIAFDSTGSNIVGRALSGRWFHWRVLVDRRPVAAIEQSVRLRHFERGIAAAPLTDAERRELRADDPGQVASGVTSAPAAFRTAPPLPPTGAQFSLLDLAAIANLDPRRPDPEAGFHQPALLTLPKGVQRYSGVDFLLGNAVQVAGELYEGRSERYPLQSRVLRFPAQFVAAIDVLAFLYGQTDGEVASVRLHYADGGTWPLQIMQGRDVLDQAMDWGLYTGGRWRTGWEGTMPHTLLAAGRDFAPGENTYAGSQVVRLENPEPQRAVVGVSFDTPTKACGLMFLAATLEPQPNDSGGR